MTRALVAVGGLLVLCLVVLGAAVWLGREEEHLAVDADLANRLALAVTEARATERPLDLTEVAPFAWDRVVIVPRGTPREEVSERLGFEFGGELPYDVESPAVLLFANGSTLARFADYRGVLPFRGIPVELPRDAATLEVGADVRPASG